MCRCSPMSTPPSLPTLAAVRPLPPLPSASWIRMQPLNPELLLARSPLASVVRPREARRRHLVGSVHPRGAPRKKSRQESRTPTGGSMKTRHPLVSFAAGAALLASAFTGITAAQASPATPTSVTPTAASIDTLVDIGAGLQGPTGLKATVYTHPTAANCCVGLLPGISEAAIEFGTHRRHIARLSRHCDRDCQQPVGGLRRRPLHGRHAHGRRGGQPRTPAQ